MRFKENIRFGNLCNLFTFLLYFSKEVKEQKCACQGSPSAAQKCK